MDWRRRNPLARAVARNPNAVRLLQSGRTELADWRTTCAVWHENGKFAWIMDPDDHKIELWEPKVWDDKNKGV